MNILLFLVLSLTGIQGLEILRVDEKPQEVVYHVSVYNYADLEPLLNPASNNDTLYIFNFWATYCAPCIKELPMFEDIKAEYASSKVKVVLISLDFKKQLDSRVIPFLVKHHIQSEVILLSDPDTNTWIDKIEPTWSGAIPATLFVRGKQRAFYEKEFKEDELRDVVKQFLE